MILVEHILTTPDTGYGSVGLGNTAFSMVFGPLPRLALSLGHNNNSLQQ